MQVKPSKRLETFHNYEKPFRERMSELEQRGKNIISFAGSDVHPFGYMPPKYVQEALIKAAKKNLTMYPSIRSSIGKRFREAVVAREKKVHGVSYDPEDVIWTNGVTHAHELLYFSLLDPGDECLLLEPTYLTWCEFGYVYSDKIISVRGGVEENEWQVDPDDIRAKITEKSKVLIMVNPNNPTGAVWDRKTVKEIIDIAGEHDILVISDEIYDLIVFDGLKSVPAASVANDVPVITLNGLTKNWLAQGWRVGYMLFHDPEGKMEQFKKKLMDYVDFLLLMPPTMADAAAEVLEKSLEKGGMDHIDALNRKLEKHRDYLWKRLNEIDGISCVKPRSGYFSFPLIEGIGRIWKDEREFVYDLLEHGVYVRPGFLFGKVYGQRHVRMSFILPIDMMRKGLDRLEAFMKKRMA